jgi:membrane protein
MKPVASPNDLTVRAWWHALRDAGKAFNSNHLTDRAAALTYYSVLSVFPALIVLISLLGVLGNQDTVDTLLRMVDDLGPSSASDTLRPALENIVESSGAASIALVIGSAVALYSASGYIGAFIRSSNEIWEVEEERPFWKLRPLQILITLGMVTILTAILLVVVLSGPLADAIGGELGVGDTALQVWSIVRWPLLFCIVVGVIALLYRVAPDARRQGFGWLLPGAGLATVLWLAASAGFNLYVTNFGSYANTYGSLAGVVVFFIWLWLTNLAVLFGAQFAEELERTAAAAGQATDNEGFVPFVSHDREPSAEYTAAPGDGNAGGSESESTSTEPVATPPRERRA